MALPIVCTGRSLMSNRTVESKIGWNLLFFHGFHKKLGDRSYFTIGMVKMGTDGVQFPFSVFYRN